MALQAIERSVLSAAPIRVPVYAEVNGIQFNVSAMTVEMAFKVSGTNPGVSDWQAGSWDIDTTGNPTVYKAQCKPTGLVAGTYIVWLRLTGTDVPVFQAGILKLY